MIQYNTELPIVTRKKWINNFLKIPTGSFIDVLRDSGQSKHYTDVHEMIDMFSCLHTMLHSLSNKSFIQNSLNAHYVEELRVSGPDGPKQIVYVNGQWEKRCKGNETKLLRVLTEANPMERHFNLFFWISFSRDPVYIERVVYKS